jgi:hypothetical protein
MIAIDVSRDVDVDVAVGIHRQRLTTGNRNDERLYKVQCLIGIY